MVRILNPARLMNPPCYYSLSGVVANDFNKGCDDDDNDDQLKKVEENSVECWDREKYPREDRLYVDSAQGLWYLTLAMLIKDIAVILMK